MPGPGIFQAQGSSGNANADPSEVAQPVNTMCLCRWRHHPFTGKSRPDQINAGHVNAAELLIRADLFLNRLHLVLDLAKLAFHSRSDVGLKRRQQQYHF